MRMKASLSRVRWSAMKSRCPFRLKPRELIDGDVRRYKDLLSLCDQETSFDETALQVGNEIRDLLLPFHHVALIDPVGEKFLRHGPNDVGALARKFGHRTPLEYSGTSDHRIEELDLIMAGGGAFGGGGKILRPAGFFQREK